MSLSEKELAELAQEFTDVMNYDSDDPTESIDPLTYQAPDGDSCLHIAASRNNHRAVALLLKAGVDVNGKGDMGCTPLHYAVMNSSREVVELLLRHGASKTIKNEFGVLPMDAKSK
jgi:ankyrin repeat protein